MTAVCAYVDKKGTVFVGADAASSNVYTSRTVLRPKVLRKDNFLIGYTTSFRMADIIEHHFDLPTRKVGQSLENYLVCSFVGGLRNSFISEGFNATRDGQHVGGHFIVACEGRIFEILENYAVVEPATPYGAVGSGHEWVLGAMHGMLGLDSNVPGKELVVKALAAAEKFSANVKAPFLVLSQPGSFVP